MRNRVKRDTLANARQMRASPTAFEKRLWKAMRGLKAEGYHFRRQVPSADSFWISPSMARNWPSSWTDHRTQTKRGESVMRFVMPSSKRKAIAFFGSTMAKLQKRSIRLFKRSVAF
jgi:hypothetical protein